MLRLLPDTVLLRAVNIQLLPTVTWKMSRESVPSKMARNATSGNILMGNAARMDRKWNHYGNTNPVFISTILEKRRFIINLANFMGWGF
jgi:hypothetical protein